MMRTFLAFSAAIAAFFSVPAACAPPLRPKIVGIASIAFKAGDAKAARGFYSTILGFQEAAEITVSEGGGDHIWFKVNDHQSIEVDPIFGGPKKDDKLIHVVFETTDVGQLSEYLASKSIGAPEYTHRHREGLGLASASKHVTVPANICKGFDGNLYLTVQDPDGHSIDFVQYQPASILSRPVNPSTPDTRVSGHILHVGIFVKDRAKADAFYKDVLGFRPMWEGNIESPTHPVALLVPDGGDWLEYTVMKKGNKFKPEQLGAINHVCLEVKEIQAPYKTVIERGYQPPHEPSIGTSGHWLANLFDPDGSRVELMVRKVARTPCCSPLFDPYMDAAR
jgi:catechol 2,3-dioxygenase-like lactoylglutathione lyase family enzyme